MRPRRRNLVKNCENLMLDIWTEILARIPVRKLLTYRCVCKDWNSLIMNRKFQNLHLQSFNNNSDSKFLLSLEIKFDHNRWVMNHVVVVRHSNTFRKVEEFRLSGQDSRNCDYLGYVDGVMVLHRVIDTTQIISEISLWNPSLQRTIRIPLPFETKNLETKKQLNVGFGFDTVSNVYKVVVVRMECAYYIRYMVYHLCVESSWSLESQSKCPNPTSELYMKPLSWMTNFEGGIYWMCYDTVDRNCALALLRFDLSSEQFSCVSLPEDEYKMRDKRGKFIRLSVMNKSLVVLDCYYAEHINVWAMSKGDRLEAGTNVDLWTKIYSVDLCIREYVHLKNNGGLLFREFTKGVMSYDLEKSKLNCLAKSHRPSILFTRTYEESLVLLEMFIKKGRLVYDCDGNKASFGQHVNGFSTRKRKCG